MKILAVDTTATAASVAVCEDGMLLGEFFVNIKQTHSETLMPMVGSLLKTCGIKLSEIGLFAVACGPGSFTGVRIGVAAVKGMALPLSVPCAAVSALEALALNVMPVEGVICPLMDARRSQFYNALFESGEGGLRRLTEDRAVDIVTLTAELNSIVLAKKKVYFVGDGAKICYNNLSVKDSITVASEGRLYQHASSVAAIALSQYNAGLTISANELLPLYLRLPQAERELKLKKHTATAL